MSKQAYPLPKSARPKKPEVLPLTEFPSREAWEESIFKDALYFTVVRFGVPSGSQTYTCETFPEALEQAKKYERALIYCVNAQGNAFCLVKGEYDKYSKIWQDIKQSLKGGSK